MLRRFVDLLADLGALLFLGAVVLLLHRELAFTDAVLGDYDLVAYFYPYREYASAALREGRVPLWNPLIFGGVPFLANIQAAFFYPVNWLGLWLDTPRLVGWSLLAHYGLAGGAMYFFCRRALSLDRLAALLGGTAYMLSGFLAAQAGHPNQVAAAAWLPALFLCFDEAMARRSAPLGVLGGLVLTLQLLSGHPQESYYSGVGLGLFAAYRVFRPRRQLWAVSDRPVTEGTPLMVSSSNHEQVRPWTSSRHGDATGARPSAESPPETGRTGHTGDWSGVGRWLLRTSGRAVLAGAVLGVIGGLGAANAAVQLLPAAQLARYSIRAGGLPYELATVFSLPPWDALRALLPAFRDYAFGEHIAYVGVVPLLLAALALLLRRDHPLVPFFGGLAALALLLALGRYTPLYHLVFTYVPGVALFRVPARWLLLFVFSLSVLAAVGLSSLALPRSFRPWTWSGRWSWGLTVVIGLTLLVAFGVAAGSARLQGTLPDDEILLRWGGLAAVGGGIAIAGMWLAPTRGLAAALLLLSLAELGLARQGLGYLYTFPPQVLSSLRPAQTVVLEGGPGRVLSLAETDFPPGDLRDVRATLERSLGPDDTAYALSLMNLKEAFSPNVSMNLGVASLDGYDGGMLPLRSFADIKGVLMDSAARRSPPDPARAAPQADRLLRLELPGIPETRLLAGLGVKYIIADKQGDAWPEGVYYDLALVRPVWPGMPLTLRSLPEFETTAVGLMTFVDGAEDLADGASVARVTVVDASGTTTERVLQLGRDTGYGHPAGTRAHPAVAARWRGKTEGHSYLTRVLLGGARYPQRIQIEALSDRVTLYVQAVSLTDERLGVSQTVTLDPSLRLIHVGDLKVYQNLDWVAPLYLASAATVLPDSAEAARALRTVAPDTVVLSRGPRSESPAATSAVPPSAARGPTAPAQAVVFSRPEPEIVQTEVNLAAPGFLVFLEAWYPGWKAWVDGQEVEILPANGLFQAVAVPAGRHRVEFRYRSTVFELGWEISRLSLALTTLLLGGSPLVGLLLRCRRGTAANAVQSPPETSSG